MNPHTPHSLQDHASCQNCTIYKAASLKKLGVNMDSFDYMIALAGNPNTGKSTVFNSLTGLRQHTGNWPGKTVARAEGAFEYQGKRYKIVDLPGTYSLLSTSVDEEVARDFLLFGHPHAAIVVVDATRLERNLNLALQVLEITDRVVLCVNLMDEARRHRLIIDDRALARDLGIPVVLASARQGEGIPELLKTLSEVASGQIVCKPKRLQNEPKELKQAIDQLVVVLRQRYPGISNPQWIALRLLDADERIIEALQRNELGNLDAYSVEKRPVQELPASA